MPKLKSIGVQAFFKCDALKKVGMPPSSVTSINRSAFCGCTSLESIGDLRSLTEIDYYAFENCNNLTLRVLPDSYAEQYAKSNSIQYTYIDV